MNQAEGKRNERTNGSTVRPESFPPSDRPTPVLIRRALLLLNNWILFCETPASRSRSLLCQRRQREWLPLSLPNPTTVTFIERSTKNILFLSTFKWGAAKVGGVRYGPTCSDQVATLPPWNPPPFPLAFTSETTPLVDDFILSAQLRKMPALIPHRC